MTQVHASEGLTHWYERDGSPRYTIVGANGKERPTTLRDARKHGYVPSVTEILKCSAKPALERWKREQMMLAALTLPRLEGEPEAGWLKRVEHDAQETARKAAHRGTDVHAAVQGHFEGEPPHAEFYEHVRGAVTALSAWSGPLAFNWVAERSFASPLGYGGKCDLHSMGFVADVKTKEFGPEKAEGLDVYDDHFMQLAAYRHGLEMPTARCAIVYVSVTHPGLVKLIEVSQEDLAKGWRMFYSLLQFWKARSGFESSFDRLLAA